MKRLSTFTSPGQQRSPGQHLVTFSTIPLGERRNSTGHPEMKVTQRFVLPSHAGAKVSGGGRSARYNLGSAQGSKIDVVLTSGFHTQVRRFSTFSE